MAIRAPSELIKASKMHVAPWIFSMAVVVVCSGLVLVYEWSTSGLLVVIKWSTSGLLVVTK